METRIDAGLISALACSSDRERLIEESKRTSCGLLPVLLLERSREFKQSLERIALRNHQVAQMRAEGRDEVEGVESLREHLVELQQRRLVVTCEKSIDEGEAMFV